jgi:hypothetical protein
MNKKAAAHEFHLPIAILWIHQDYESHPKMRPLEREEAEQDFKFSMLLEGPNNCWLVGFR